MNKVNDTMQGRRLEAAAGEALMEVDLDAELYTRLVRAAAAAGVSPAEYAARVLRAAFMGGGAC